MMQFQNSLDWIAALIIIVWLIGVALDIRFRVNRFKAIRLTLWTLGMVCVMLLYLEPYRPQESQTRKVALVSDSYTGQVDSLRSAGYLLASPTTVGQTLQTENISELVLVEQTLKPWELQAVNAEKLSFKPAEVDGIIDFQLPSRIRKGKEIDIELTINVDQNHYIHWSLGDESLDSLEVKRGSSQVTINLIPKASGNQIYALNGISGADTLYSEILPMKVENPEVPAVLILSSNPNFETRFLKNHLGDFGYAVSSRTNISSEIANEEFINAQRSNLAYLTESKLQQYQLLIIDSEAFSGLSRAEQKHINTLNRTGNLGILVISTPPESMKGLWTVAPKSELRQANILGNDLQVYTSTSSALNSITVNQQPIAYYQSNGIGKIGLLAIINLYQLKLDGQTKIYEQLVKKITQPVMPFQKSNELAYLPEVVRFEQKTHFQFMSRSKAPKILIDGVSHPVRESAFRPHFYEVSFWPQREGWNSFTILPDSVSYDYFVFSKEQWASKEQFELNRYNDLYARTYQKQTKGNTFKSKEAISKWYFLIGFLTCMTLLWAEQRFVNP
ncbi:MAG: hypothetical protein RIC35_05670 [Marinoscillum sp.]